MIQWVWGQIWIFPYAEWPLRLYIFWKVFFSYALTIEKLFYSNHSEEIIWSSAIELDVFSNMPITERKIKSMQTICRIFSHRCSAKLTGRSIQFICICHKPSSKSLQRWFDSFRQLLLCKVNIFPIFL